MTSTIYERIRQRREELHMSQEELAAKLHYKSRSTLAKIEAGACDITTSKLVAFADALEVPVEWLMGMNNYFYTDLDKKIQEDTAAKQQDQSLTEILNDLRSRIIQEHENPYTTFLTILFKDRPDIIDAIKSMTLEGNMTYNDMLCNLDAQKLDFIKNSVIMSFEQAKLTGKKVAKINATKGEVR